MRVLMVSGSRHGCAGRQLELLYRAVEWAEYVILGGAQGVDDEADRHCKKSQIDHRVFMAKWETGRGKKTKFAAGPARNAKMIAHGLELQAQGHELRAVCFPAPDSKGTLDFIQKCKDAGVKHNVFPQAIPGAELHLGEKIAAGVVPGQVTVVTKRVCLVDREGRL